MLLCHAHLYMTFFSKWADDMLYLPTWCGSPSKAFSQPSEQDFRIRVKYIELQGCFIELEESSQKWHSLSGEGEVCKNLPINSYYYPRAFFLGEGTVSWFPVKHGHVNKRNTWSATLRPAQTCVFGGICVLVSPSAFLVVSDLVCAFQMVSGCHFCFQKDVGFRFVR